MAFFREKVLRKISSPDELDRLSNLTTPSGWLLLALVAVLLFALIVWSVFGSISVTLQGNGITEYSGGLIKEPASASGEISRWFVEQGDMVKKGQPLCEIHVQDLEQQLRQVRQDLKSTNSSSQQYATLLNTFEILTHKINNAPLVLALSDGKITTVLKKANEVIKEGEPVAILSSGDTAGNLGARVYIANPRAKSLKPGAIVRMEPGSARADKYGYLVGKIDSVSEWPVNSTYIADNVANENLVNWLIGGRADLPVYEIAVSLIPDENSKNNYMWTSAAGGRVEISPGTTLTAHCEVTRKRPVEMALEWLGEFFGI